MEASRSLNHTTDDGKNIPLQEYGIKENSTTKQ